MLSYTISQQQLIIIIKSSFGKPGLQKPCDSPFRTFFGGRSCSNLWGRFYPGATCAVQLIPIGYSLLSVPKFTAKLYCISLSIDLWYSVIADAVKVSGKFSVSI